MELLCKFKCKYDFFYVFLLIIEYSNDNLLRILFYIERDIL